MRQKRTNRCSQEILLRIREQSDKQNAGKYALLATQLGRSIGLQELISALTHALPEQLAGHVKRRSSRGNHMDEAKAIARKVLNAMGHLIARMSVEEESKALQIQAARQEALASCVCKKETRASSATNVPRIGEESRNCRLCRCCSRMKERLKSECAVKTEGARSAKYVFCGKRLRTLWRLQAKSSEGNSARACYRCVLHATIAKSLHEEAAKKEREEEEHDRREE